MKKTVFILLFSSVFIKSFAHEDFMHIKKYGNVKVCIKTGFNFEEIKKIEIIGIYAKKLSNELNYTEPIFLDFNHDYTKSYDPVIFLGFNPESNDHSELYGGRRKRILDKGGIIISQRSQEFNIERSLHLLEYAIKKIEYIKNVQKETSYIKDHYYYGLKTIGKSMIDRVLKVSPSKTIKKILNEKVIRPEEKKWKRSKISYYYFNNRCFMFLKTGDKLDTVLFSLNNIYQFERVDNNRVILFETNKNFYNISLISGMIKIQKYIIPKNLRCKYVYRIEKRENEFIYISPSVKKEGFLLDLKSGKVIYKE